MDFLQTVFLALLQGLTEFLPISSSAHLILLPRLLGWDDQGLAFDVAVHIGSLSAVLAYFRQQLWRLTLDSHTALKTRAHYGDSRLALAVVLTTVPGGLAGLLLNDIVATGLRSPLVIATTTIIFGLVLWWTDAIGTRTRDEHALGWKDMVIIGVAQAISLIPGTSRSGITISAGLLCGLSRAAAARFSFLLSIPIIAAAGLLKTLELTQQPLHTPWSTLLLGALVSGVCAYGCIHWFLKLLDRIGMLPFVVYRLLLGIILFSLFA